MSIALYLINPASAAPDIYDRISCGFWPAMLITDLALPTVAALPPRDFEVTLCEEHVSRVDFGTKGEFIGITGKTGQERRMVELGRAFRARGKTVIFGGPHATLCPSRLRGECDILVRGELETVAPEFFADLRNGSWKSEYCGDKADLRTSPAPRWNGYPYARALVGSVQTSRGCPFQCEFCDVPQYSGRKQRRKTLEQVTAELNRLYDLGFRGIFFADDNLTSDQAHARTLISTFMSWARLRWPVLR